MKDSNLPMVAIGVLAIGVIAVGGILLLNQDNADTVVENDQQNVEINNTQTSEPVQVETPNIVDLASETPNLSTLVAAVQAGDLVAELSNESSQLTVFAPSNEAFAEIQDAVDDLLLQENFEQLQSVLTYHVVQGSYLSFDLQDGDVIETMNGETLTVRVEDDGNIYINDAMVVQGNVAASNGTVHIIDKVLLP